MARYGWVDAARAFKICCARSARTGAFSLRILSSSCLRKFIIVSLCRYRSNSWRRRCAQKITSREHHLLLFSLVVRHFGKADCQRHLSVLSFYCYTQLWAESRHYQHLNSLFSSRDSLKRQGPKRSLRPLAREKKNPAILFTCTHTLTGRDED
ncbi:hypothetical protein HDV63DRAFT_7959 [Trichoderma sp. SZMC 28014]